SGGRGGAAVVDVRRAAGRVGIRVVAARAVVARPVAVFRSEIRSGGKDAGEEEVGAVRPERIVIAVGPQGESEDVAEEEGPEHRPGPAAPSAAPLIPSSAVEAATPPVPPGAIAEGVAVESVVIEVMQTVEIVRGELIVRDLSARDLIVSEAVMGAVH